MRHVEIQSGAPATRLDVRNELALYRGGAVIVGVFEGGELSPAAVCLDGALDGMLQNVLDTGDMTGKKGSRTLVYTQGRISTPRVLFVGLGSTDDVDAERLRRLSGESVRHLRDLGISKIGTTLHSGLPIDPAPAGEAIAEGAFLALYAFTQHKTDTDEDGEKKVEELVLLDPEASVRAALAEGAAVGKALAHGTNIARDLANQPPNFLPPLTLAERARLVAEEVGLRCRIMTEEELRHDGFNALLAVGQGSANPPAFIILEHEPDRNEKPLVFVGKGLCFDSGGLSLKGGGGDGMKHDMAGAAAVIGALYTIATLQVPRRVVGLIPAAENMPSGTAQRPNDVIYSLSGKTIEVRNTDAEGRLVLADALAYAKRLDPEAVVDLATLTGSCVTALGHETCGLFGRHDADTDALVERIRAAADATHERVWRLPLWDEYDEQIKSDIADVQNIGSGKGAGPIVGAAFLKAFAEGYPWVHLDIAGMMTSDSTSGYAVKGATGFGSRLLTHLARRWEG